MNYERCHKHDLCSNAPDHYGKCDVSAHASEVLAEARRVAGDNADIALKYRSMIRTLLDRHNGRADTMMLTILSPVDVEEIREVLNDY